MDNYFGSYMIGAVRAIMSFNGQGWQGNEGGSDSDIGSNVGASIEKMLLGLVYAKDTGSVRAMYNAEQQWQVSKYEGWEQQAQEQARLEAIAAMIAAIKANPGVEANGTVQPSIFPTFDQIDWNNVKFLDDPQYQLDPETVEQTKKFYAWLNSTEGAQILKALKMVAQSPEMQQLLRASADAVAKGANTLDNVTMALWTEAGPVAEIPVAFTYSGEIILKGTSKALAAFAEKCGNFAIKEVRFTSTLLASERGSAGISTSKILFRGERSSVSPDIAFKNGFIPKGTHNNLALHVTSNTTAGNFISTTLDKKIAQQFAGNNGYVYEIETSNYINVNNTLGAKSPFPEQMEFAIPGGVSPS